MQSSSFRNTLFSDLINIHDNLDNQYEIYEQKIFDYLKNLENHASFSELTQYSNKLQNLKNYTWLNGNSNENIDIEKDCFKGRLVLIDFWTYCCINCMHIIPLLNQLESEYQNLLVIGIHSSKFTNEKSKLNIFNAARRHLIKHPIVCDFDLKLWNMFEIICWPTLMLINPHGLVIGIFEGEIQANIVKKLIPCCFKYYKNELQQLAPVSLSKLTISSSNDIFDGSNLNSLNFPTKLCADEVNKLLFISDSGNNRILCIDTTTYEIKYQIGSGTRGHLDDNFESCQFDWPQGLAYDSETNLLYIADTFNDLIRVADLNKRLLKTLCGVSNKTDKLIGDYDLVGGNLGETQAISSPWDLQIMKKDNSICILIACAGTHQIWLYSFKNENMVNDSAISCLNLWKNKSFEWNRLICIAGNGKERNKNNSYPMQASFAQPSGLCLDNKNENLYIADAESSTIRVLNMNDGSVKNIAGGNNLDPDDLFSFGDCDDKADQAKFQHPLDVRFYSTNNNLLLVADTYNHSLRKIDIKTKLVQKLNLSQSILSEPNGLCILDNNLFIADTNNHELKMICLNDINSESVCLSSIQIKFKNQCLDSVESSNKINRTINKSSFKVSFIKIKLNEQAENRWKAKIFYKNKKSELKLEGSISYHDVENQSLIYNLNELEILDVNDLIKMELKLKIFYCQNDVCKFSKIIKKYDREDIFKCSKNSNYFITIEI